MTLPDYAKFKAISDINRPFITNNLVNGVIDFCNWSLLNIGGFVNVTRSPAVSGVYGGDRFRLRRVTDGRFTVGTVYEGFRSNWVWESGLDYTTQPIHSSGVWINDTFYTSNHATYGHYVDYPRGRVVFNNSLPANTVVQTEFACRTAFFVDSETDYVQRLMWDTWDVSRSDWLGSSGNWSDLSDLRLQLPIVGVKIVDNMSFAPYALGGGQWCNTDVLYYIFTEDKYTKRQLCDILAAQNDKTIWIPNYALMKSDPDYPLSLNYYGTPVVSAVQYPDLVGESGYRWRKVQFMNTKVQDNMSVHNNLHKAIVRTTVQIIMYNI
jgi:hypothetical protein